MHFYSLLLSAAVIIHLALAAFIVAKRPTAYLNRLIAAMALVLAVWSFAEIFLLHPGAPKSLAITFANVGAIGWCSFASLFLWFSLIFADANGSHRLQKMYPLLLLFPVLFICRQWTGGLIIDFVRQPYGWSGIWAPSPWTDFFNVYFLSFSVLGLCLVFRFGQNASSAIKRKQSTIIVTAGSVSLLFGALLDRILPRLGVYTVPQLAVFTGLIWSSGLVYALARYRFLTITPITAAQNIIATMKDFLILLNPQGRITSVNPFTLDCLGYQENELRDAPLDSLLEGGITWNSLRDVLHNGEEVDSLSAVFVQKKGERVPVLLSASALKDEARQTAGIVVAARDITARVRAEERLRKAHNELETQVKERTAELIERAEQLQIISDVGRRISAILHLDELLSFVATTIAESFGYYHVDIFLVEPSSDYAIFAASNDPLVKEKWDESVLRMEIGKEGMIGWVAQTGEVALSNDVTQEPRYLHDPLLAETKSEFAIPLKIQEKIVGVLDINSDRRHGFSSSNVTVLQTLANQIAVAIENAKLFQEGQRHTEEMNALREVSLATLSALDRDRVFEIMLDQLGKVIDYNNAAVKIISTDGKDKMIAARGPVVHDQAMWDGYDANVSKAAQEMIETRQPVVVHDTRTDERFRKVGDWEAFLSWAGAPLFVRDDLVGYLMVEKTTPHFYDARALKLLEDFAHAAAIALDNAKLHEATKRRAEEMSALHRIALLATSTLDPNEVLELIYEQVSHLTKPDTFYIALYDEQHQKLNFEIFAEKGERFDKFSRQAEEVGLSWWIIRSKKPLLMRNMAKELPPVVPGVVGEPLPPELCYLGVPIMKKDKVIGVVSVQSFRPYTYDEEDQRFLSAIADQTAIALENARLFEEEKQRTEELAALNELGKALTARLSVQDVLVEAHHQASRLVKSSNLYIGLYDEEKDEVRFPLNVSESEIDNQITVMSVSQGLTGYIIRNRTSLLLGKNGLDWQEQKGIETIGQEAPSWLGVPLLIGDRVLGAMVVQSFTTPDLYDEHDRALLTAIASPTAIALQNAYLFEQTESALEALHASEERFALAVQGSNDGIWDWDIQKDSLYWSPRMKELLGYADDELDADFDTLDSALHPDDRERTKATIEACLKDGGLYNLDHRIRTKSGEYRWFHDRGQVVFDEDGNPIRMIGSTADITDRKLVEEEIRKLSKLQQSIIDHANVWLSVLDEEAVVVTWNKAAEAISGYCQEEAVGNEKLWGWLYPDEAYRKGRIEKAKALMEGSVEAFDEATTIRCKDGQDRIMSWHVQDLHTETGKVTGLLCIGLDVTEQRQAEERLNATLQGMIEALGQTTETRDLYTASHQKRVTQLACAIAEEMGLSNEHIEGIRVAGLLHDIGKLSIPAEILSKPSKLSETEYNLFKSHSQVAYNILRTIEFPWPVAQIVLQHHERMDGSGYPQGLEGEQILMEARILAVADVVEAMASHRPYRPALGMDKALEEIAQQKGTLYDPVVADACLRLFEKETFSFESNLLPNEAQRLISPDSSVSPL